MPRTRRPWSLGSFCSSSSRSSAGRRSDVTLTELAPGLHRWTTRHEAWKEDVGCVAVDTDDGLVLIDSLDPPRELGRAEHALVTVFFHARSTLAKHVWAEQRLLRRLGSGGGG